MRRARRLGDEPARDLLAALEALYAEIDAHFEGSSCEQSTDCCHFARTGREPYVTSLEADLLERAIRRSGAPTPRARASRGLPIASDEGRCPLLDDRGRCRVYTARPLGCRTFHCARADVPRPLGHQALLGFVRRLKDLAAQHRPGGAEGRRLRRALG